MKRLSTAVAAIALIGTPAFAADMGVPSAPPPAPVYNWTGWYIGVNAGASMGKATTDFNGPFTLAKAGSIPLSGAFGFAGSDTTSPSGFIGGGQIGYNWQFSPLIVVGLEADFQGALERDSITLTNNFSGIISGCNGPNGGCAAASVVGSTVLEQQTKIDWFGTVRGRIGYVWGNGQVLTYVTGGLAYGEVKTEGTGAVNGLVGGALPFSISQTVSNSHTNTGWVLGYGNEGAIDFWGAHNWTWRIETLYMDLGHLDTTGTSTTICAACTVTGGQVSTSTHFTDWILRGGLNYRF